jgi:hypothetical protein
MVVEVFSRYFFSDAIIEIFTQIRLVLSGNLLHSHTFLVIWITLDCLVNNIDDYIQQQQKTLITYGCHQVNLISIFINLTNR